MTAVVEATRLTADIGDVKIVSIISDAACDTGHTIDTNIDGTSGVEQLFSTGILHTHVQNSTGTDEECTWSNTTGVITLGTMTATGVHKITIWGY